ncbi:MAG: hypothetical protein HY822_23235 [Acidobacteria bacterium]|nr:hypothetical protein [Acidobacteriota bacterium]
MSGRLIPGMLFALLASVGVCQAPLQPVRVCEVLADLAAHEGKVTAIVGRFSFREDGRFLSEEACGRPNALRIVFDPKAAPPLPQGLEFDAAAVYRNLKLIRRGTALGKFRFGSVEYDRWAVIYGRVEAGAKTTVTRKTSFEPSPAQVLCRGESAILFLPDAEQ